MMYTDNLSKFKLYISFGKLINSLSFKNLN